MQFRCHKISKSYRTNFLYLNFDNFSLYRLYAKGINKDKRSYSRYIIDIIEIKQFIGKYKRIFFQ